MVYFVTKFSIIKLKSTCTKIVLYTQIHAITLLNLIGRYIMTVSHFTRGIYIHQYITIS